MQYKGVKKMKRVAAVILSAAIVLTDVPGVSAAEYAQTSETETVEESIRDDAAGLVMQEEMPESETSLEETVTGGGETQQQTEINAEGSTDAQQTAPASDAETKPAETKTEQEETGATQVTGIEESGIEETKIGETKIEESGIEETKIEESGIEESGTEESESIEELSETGQVQVPDVDDSVYALEQTDYTNTDNASSFFAYNAQGTLTQNEQGEYVIENRDQFFLFLSSSADYSGSKVLLNCDVDMRGESAQLAKSFDGEFNGNGHSIYNYKSGGGLFRQIGADGTVKKLHLSGITFMEDASASALASTNNGSVSEVTVNADINVTKSMTAAAGIVLVNSGTISDCAYAGTVTAESGLDNLEKPVGGIVSDNKGVITNCHALGGIHTNMVVLGGIAAKNSKTIQDSANYMSVTGAYYAGGIVAENTGTVTNCKNYGAVSQKDNSVEGLAGGIAASNTGNINDCENYAQVSGEYKSIGGIAGNSTQTISGCGNYGAVTGCENVGGIVGLFSGSGGTVKNCFNKGKVSARSNKNSHEQGIGGILGAVSSNNTVCVIQNCYNIAAVSGASDIRYIGGIAGVLYKGSISNAYNAGEISASAIKDDFNPYAAMIAGFMGKEEDASYTDCLFAGASDILCYRKSGVVLAKNEKLTADELKGQDALSTLGGGFSADENAINGGYPVISGQKAKTETYLVIYDPNGGCADYYFSKTQDGIAKPSATPTRKGASFLGWYKDKEHKDEYSFGSVTKSEVIYAGWELRQEVEDIRLDQTDVTLIMNESFDIKPQVLFTPENAQNKELVFRSDDPSVATVDENGIVKAVGVGTANVIIRLADNSLDKELTFTVKVSNAQNIVRFKLYNDESEAEITKATISVGEPVIIQAVFGADTPEKATLQWSSSNPACVKKTERTDLIKMNAVELEGLKPTADGSRVEITCILKYPDNTEFIGVLYVTVRPLAQSVSISLGRDDATGKDVVYDIDTKQFIAIGTNKLSEPVQELSASILPKAADQKVKWSSSDTAVIKFDDEESGKAVGNKSGEATVTAIPAVLYGKGADGKEVKGAVRVKTRRIIQSMSFTPKPADKNGVISYDQFGRIEITDGMSIKLEPTYVPADATIKKVSWTNSNKNALDISVAEGTNVATVKAKKVVENTVVKLTAKATDMGEASYELAFIVKPKVEKINIYKKSDTDHENCLSDGSVGVDKSETFDLIAVNEPENSLQRVTWKISNTKIADLTENADGSCTIKVKDKGTAQITATAADGTGIKATTTLNVASLASEVEIEGSHMVMVGGKITLTASVYPKSASNSKIKWESSTPEYAKVDEKTGVVTGVATGTGSMAATAVIKATVQDGSNATKRHTVTVYAAPEKFDLMIPDGDKNEKNDKLLTGKTIGIDPDLETESYEATYTVAPRVLPEKACQEVEWKSSNEKVATVKDGVITAHTFGKATITASAIDGSNRKASVTVNVATLVTDIKITGGHYIGISDKEDIELQLKATVEGKDATNKSVVWKSEYPSIAEVDQSGLVIANAKAGSTKITAEAADGSGVIAEHMVYVASSRNKVTINRDDSGVGEWNVDKNDNRSIEGIDLADRETVEIRLKAELNGGSPERDNFPMELKWSTSNKNIATVEADETDSHRCTVTLHNKGVSGKKSVKITATTTEGYEASASVTIKDIQNTNPWVTITGPGHQLANGKKMQLSAGDIAVKWYSDNPSVAVVDEKKGVVKADRYMTGTARITAVPVIGKGNPNWDTYVINVAAPTSKVDITLNDGRIVTNKKLGVDIVKGYDGMKRLKPGALLDGVASEEVTWKSSNKSIATFDEDGYLDINKTGTVTLTAQALDGSNKKGKVTLVVTKQTTRMWPAGDRKIVTVGLKKSVQLNVEYRPLGTTMKKAQWKSSDESIVKVNKNSGKVTGVREGEAVITAEAIDGSGISCTFNVKVAPAINKVEIVKVEADGIRNAYRDVVGVDLGPGSREYTTNLSANFYTKSGKEDIPLNAENQYVEWSSSNKAVAEVNENGLVTVHKAGEVTIKATAADGSKRSGKIKLYAGRLVSKIDVDKDVRGGIDLYLSMKEYRTFDLSGKIDVYPLIASNKTLVYTSTNKKCVTVNSKGKVTAKKPTDEPVYIVVTTKDGSGIYVEIPVTVTK